MIARRVRRWLRRQARLWLGSWHRHELGGDRWLVHYHVAIPGRHEVELWHAHPDLVPER